jgi:glycoside/pentoside/hexuronide:cation symporter, GPH family
MNEPAAPRLSLAQKLAYASGQAGAIIGLQLIATNLLALYTPPAGAGEQRVPGLLLGVGTFLVISVLARAVDTPFDPWIANLSDRSTHRLGRRRFFMLISVLPLALSTGLVFFPPVAGESMWNVVWVAAALSAYYCLFSTYVAPYLALLPELAPDKNENTVLSTMMAAAALVGGMLVTVVAPLAFLSDKDTDRTSMQMMAAALAAASFVFMLIPVLFIDERKLIARKEGEAATQLGLFASLKETFKERAFIPYVFGMNLFFVGFTIIQTAAPYYVEVLLARPLTEQGAVIGPLFGVGALAFPVIAWLANKFGKRNLMIGGSVALAVFMAVGVPLLRPSAGMVDAQMGAALFLFALAGVPVAMFLALPNAMIADICEANAKKTGQRREAVFFGAQGFIQKIMLGVATGLVGWSGSLFGQSREDPLGVQLTGPLAAAALLGAALCFYKYPEARVQAEMRGEAPPSA